MHIKLNDERLVNLDKVVEIRISDIDDTAVKYIFDTTEVIIEKFDSNANAKAAIAKVTDSAFLDTKDGRKVNKNYIKDVKINAVDSLKVEFVMFDGAPIKVLYDTADNAEEALTQVIANLVEE